jgi:DNA uptake protein ComE-like DNA-binding protein
MTDGGQNTIGSFAFVVAVTICILVSSWFVVSNLLGFRQACGIKLEERINPNNAPAASLARLPGIGELRR